MRLQVALQRARGLHWFEGNIFVRTAAAAIVVTEEVQRLVWGLGGTPYLKSKCFYVEIYLAPVA